MIRQHHLIRGTIALAAALTASLAPAAWADPAPLAKTEARIAANSQSGTAVQPNPDEQIPSNAPTVTGTSCGDVCSGHGYGPVNVSTRAIPSVRPPSSAAPSSGFDWGDAGIGAGSILALTLIGVGGALAAINRRGRHTHQGQTSASR
jgi:hypothetical protein